MRELNVKSTTLRMNAWAQAAYNSVGDLCTSCVAFGRLVNMVLGRAHKVGVSHDSVRSLYYFCTQHMQRDVVIFSSVNGWLYTQYTGLTKTTTTYI